MVEMHGCACRYQSSFIKSLFSRAGWLVVVRWCATSRRPSAKVTASWRWPITRTRWWRSRRCMAISWAAGSSRCRSRSPNSPAPPPTRAPTARPACRVRRVRHWPLPSPASESDRHHPARPSAPVYYLLTLSQSFRTSAVRSMFSCICVAFVYALTCPLT